MHLKSETWIFRDFSKIISLISLGFIFCLLFTLGNVVSFLLGYWPDWYSQIYLYLFLIIIFIPIFVKGKNYYCGSICPFVATQECLGLIGKAQPRIPFYIRKHLIWLPRILALIVMIFALLEQNPGIQSHEIFATFFQLTGSNIQFILMAVVIISALFITRSFCTYLCPIRGITDFVIFSRRKIMSFTRKN